MALVFFTLNVYVPGFSVVPPATVIEKSARVTSTGCRREDEGECGQSGREFEGFHVRFHGRERDPD